jgi:WD40 repeat protein
VDFGVSTTRVIGGTFDGDIAVYNSGVLGAVLDTRLEFGALRLEALPDINGVVFNTYNALYLFRFANSEITLLLGNEMGELEQERVFGFDLHSDGTTLAAGVGSKIVLYDLESREIMNQWSLPDLESDAPTVLVFALAWHPDATQLATLRTDGTLEVWAVETGELLASWQLYNSAYSQKWG